MSKVYIFDVDGTLTPSRLPMTDEFQKFFKEWIKKNKFYLVTGSDLPKLQEQMCNFDTDAEGIFTCCGNEFWKPDPSIVNVSAEQVYRQEFKPPKELIEYLEHQLEIAPYLSRCGNHIEDRGSMLNFSVIGRNCTQEQRELYFKYDIENKERKNIAEQIKKQWPKLDAVIGGQISIDIYPKGNDKSQILDIIEQERLVKPDEYIFIGDGINNKGNDWPLAKLMLTKKEYCSSYHTTSWKQTKEILNNFK